MVLYFVGTIGPIDSVYHLYNSIKNMFNSFNDFYSKMSQSFIDYLKHIFGDAPKPPKPDLPKLPPRPKTSSIYEYINKVSGKNDSFFSLRRLYALKESFNNATGYYTSWSDAVFSLETVKNISYFLMFGIFVYFVYLNYENIGGLITTIANGLYNYVVQLPVNTFNFVISIPTKIYNGVAAAYTSVWEYFTNFTLFPPRDNTRFAQYQYQAPEPLPRIPSETPSYRELRDSIASVFGNVNPAAQVHPSAASTSTVAAGTALPASEIATTGTHSAWGSNTPAAPVTNPPSYNPAAVGLNLTNSQLAGLSPKKIQGLCLPPARWRTKAPPGQCEYLNI